MRNLTRYAIYLLVIGLMSCSVAGKNLIPAGTYIRESGGEKIVVTPSTISFHVNVYPEDPDLTIHRQYRHEVLPDGRIVIVVPDNQALSGMGAYNWYWRDGMIAKVDWKTGNITWFVMQTK